MEAFDFAELLSLILRFSIFRRLRSEAANSSQQSASEPACAAWTSAAPRASGPAPNTSPSLSPRLSHGKPKGSAAPRGTPAASASGSAHEPASQAPHSRMKHHACQMHRSWPRSRDIRRATDTTSSLTPAGEAGASLWTCDPPRFWTFLHSLYARARRRPCVPMFGFSRQGR
jgi:hypothetical protein